MLVLSLFICLANVGEHTGGGFMPTGVALS